MKKILSIILAGLMTAGLAVGSMAWEKDVDYIVLEEMAPDNMGDPFGDSYPGSLDWDWVEVTSGKLLSGTIIAGCDAALSHCWSNGTDNAAKAFDGDTSSFFDPYEATTNSWCGLILDQAYELTEVRIMPRESYPDRMKGACVQGSNNGTDWVNIIYIPSTSVDSEIGITEAPAGYDYHCFTPATNDDYVAYYSDYGIEQPDMSKYWVGSGSYQYYRYVNLEGVHGDLADIEFYGNPAAATEVTSDMLNTVVIIKSDLENWYDAIEEVNQAAVVVDNSIKGIVVGGGGSYSDSASYGCAFDGDSDTFYDPATAGPVNWTGVKATAPVALTEARVLPRVGQFARTEGATIQGSNDGATWTTLATYTAEDCLADDAEQTWITKSITDTNTYTYFRYISDGTQHGDVAEVLFITADNSAMPEPEVTVEEPVVEETPVEEAPVEETPVEEAPVEEAPVEEAPVEEAPVEQAPAETEAPAPAEPAKSGCGSFISGGAVALVSVLGAAWVARRKD